MKRTATNKVWFISGHMDLTEDEFDDHYGPSIKEAWMRGDSFVVGDAPGADLMAQHLLAQLSSNDSSTDRTAVWARTCVFHMFVQPRHRASPALPALGGFTSDAERDAAMTRASDADIAWVRPGKGKRNSGTAKNLQRRLQVQRERILEGRRTWPRYVIGENYDGDHVRLYMRDPSVDGAQAHEPEPVPCPPGLYERYVAAHKEYWAVQEELRQCQVAAEMYKGEE